MTANESKQLTHEPEKFLVLAIVIFASYMTSSITYALTKQARDTYYVSIIKDDNKLSAFKKKIELEDQLEKQRQKLLDD